ncbi:MAG: hypothetical protein IID05_01770, partial [Gemmatimonadetes bacterium]|nr:hypothetical protein [Gemmatimonadota bacterium]
MNDNMNDIFEQQAQSKEAPRGLRNKVEFLARQPQKAAWFNGGFKWAAAGTAVAAAAIAAVRFMTPATSEAKTWDMVTDAYQDIRTMLIRIDIRDSDRAESITVAMKGNSWRVSVADRGDFSYSRGELLIYKAGSDTAQVIDMTGIPFPIEPSVVVKEIVSQLSVANLLKHAEDEIGKENIVISQVYTANGRRLYDVEVRDSKSGSHAFFVIDADTDLPVSVEMRGVEVEGSMHGRMSFQFNGEVDDSWLEPVLPTGVKFEYINLRDMAGGDGDFWDGFGDMFDRDDDGDDEIV